MDVTITGPVTHLCPYVDEVDVGTFEMTYTIAGEPIELHALKAFLAGFHGRKMTHEELTGAIANRYPAAEVVTYWRTAGLDVTCAVPGDTLNPAGA